MTRVLVVDDEPQILRALAINLRARHYQVFTAATGTEALSQAAAHTPDLVVLDLGLPDMDGTKPFWPPGGPPSAAGTTWRRCA